LESGFARRSGLGRAVGRLTRVLVDQVLEFLARLEIRDALRRHVHLVAGLRVAALAGLALTEAEAAESAEFDLLATLQGIDDALKDRVDNDLRVFLREVRNPRN